LLFIRLAVISKRLLHPLQKKSQSTLIHISM